MMTEHIAVHAPSKRALTSAADRVRVIDLQRRGHVTAGLGRVPHEPQDQAKAERKHNAQRVLDETVIEIPASRRSTRTAERSVAEVDLDLLPNARRWWMGGVYDQGAIHCPKATGVHRLTCAAHGFCVGAATRGMLDAGPIKNTQGLALLDIYHRAQDLDPWDPNDYEGTSTNAGLQVGREMGAIESFEWFTTEDAMLRWLATKGPVMVGTDWDWSMFFPGADNFIRPDGDTAGGHAYLIAYADRKKRRARVLNSWGTGWGRKGRAYMALPDLFSLVFGRAGDAAGVVERKVARVAA